MATLSGTPLNDKISGTSGDDIIFGGTDTSSYNPAGTGNDTLAGNAGQDTLIGGDGDDILSGGAGNDALYGGDGNDTLNGGTGADYLEGGAGDDTLHGGGFSADGGSEYLYGGDGSDLAIVDYATDTAGIWTYVSGGTSFSLYAANSYITIADIERVQITTGSGNDTLYDSTGNDVLKAGAGDDAVYSFYGSDTLDGGAGTDFLYLDRSGSTANITFTLGKTAATLPDGTKVSNFEQVTFYAGSGNDTLVGGALSDTLYGGAGDDTLTGGDGGTSLYGGEGNDTLAGGALNDTLYGDAGDDTLTGGEGGASLYGGEGNDTLVGGTQADWLSGDAGDDTLTGGSGGGDYLYGGDGNDLVILDYSAQTVDLSIYAPWWNTTYFAISGNGLYTTYSDIESVQITTGSGNDTLYDAIGNDVLAAGAGDDAVYSRYGADTLDGGAGKDFLYLDRSSATADLSFVLDASATLSVDGTTVTGFELVNIQAGSGNDTLVGGTLNDTLSGGAGDDTLTGGGGGDSLDGGEGNDTLKGGVEADTFYGGAGDDTLISGGGSDSLFGGEGNDLAILDYSSETEGAWLDGYGSLSTSAGTLYFYDVERLEVTTGSGNDTLYDTVGNDVLKAGAGDDAVYSRDGTDTLDGGAGTNFLYFDRFHASVDFAFDVTKAVNSLADGSTLSNFEQVTFYAGSGNDTLVGGALNDVLYGGAGDDTLTGGGGDDYLDGGAGNDTAILDYSAQTVDLNFYSPWWSYNNTYFYLTGNGITATLSSIERVQVSTGSGNDSVESYHGGDVLDGGAGTDFLYLDRSSTTADIIFDVTKATNSLDDGTTASNFEQVNLHAGSGNDTLAGGALNDKLSGGAGDDTLTGGGGSDDLDGGDGSDLAILDYADQTVDLNFYKDWSNNTNLYIEGYGISTYLYNIEHIQVATGSGNDTLYDALGNDVLKAGAGDDTVFSYSGGNTLDGGAGTDFLYLDRIAATVDFIFDITQATNILADGTFASNFEQIAFFSGSGNDTLVGGALNDTFHGGAGDDTLASGGGSDSIAGGDGNDLAILDYSSEKSAISLSSGELSFSNGTTYLYSIERLDVTAGSGADTLSGGDGDDILRGGGGADTLYGNAGDDVLDGGSGADTMQGGAGNDTYVVDSSKDVLSGDFDGANSVRASITFNLAAVNGGSIIQNLTLTGQNAINGIGNALDNLIIGNAADNTLNGGLGNDMLAGGAGNDTYVVDSGGDIIIELAEEGTDTVRTTVTYALAANLENLLLAGNSAISGTGNAQDNTLTGNGAANTLTGGAGNDTLDGGAGNDTLVGGTGDDTYLVDSSGDVVTELAGEGTDTLRAGFSYSLGANVENLVLTGSLAIDGFGNGLDNLLIGNSAANILAGGAGNDILDGGLGNDTLVGGAGNDSYYLDSAGDVIAEASGGGFDTIYAGFSYTLLSEFEALVLTGASAINGTGNAASNTITGNGGANLLSGLGGNDTIYGAEGNDTLSGDAGNDTLSGGSGNDILLGGEGNDTLEGGAGLDRLEGGAGNDTYIIDASVIGETADTLIDTAGIDTVRASINWTLAVNFENLVLTGSADLRGTGNAADNRIVGNAGANTLVGAAGSDTLYGQAGDDSLAGGDGNDWLEGGAGQDVLNGQAGADTMIGGAGNDTYSVDNIGDVVSEAGGSGVDTVKSSLSYTLGDGLERLTLLAGGLTGTGNALVNLLTGSSGHDTLYGLAGNDTLTGGTGNDTLAGGTGTDKLTGGAGEDLFLLAKGDGYDQITDFTVGQDKLLLSGFGAAFDSWAEIQGALHKSGSSTILDLGDGDKVIFKGVAIGSLGISDFFLPS
ncbi:hypothetical protein NON00_12855 [Roseomonas sp. GC11]|uniref:beta strand repeat-containing protein n=1 Tax=Roseomonas sp. GC11 TaxID=2950546 RepID=UPI00210B2BC4|nr:calcium-binding protein [Roseomonas sp. GC11]MCQ4160817.1 hypothetical protein [Roseomonas sp. GC11]